MYYDIHGSPLSREDRLFKDILAELLSKETAVVRFENPRIDGAGELVEMASFQALLKIKAVLENSALEDFECVEQIVQILEAIGTNGGPRHDFG